MARVIRGLGLCSAVLLSAELPVSLPMAEIEQYAREEMALNQIPGMALAIVHGDQVLLRAYGVRSLISGAAMTVDTPVELASVSKPLTAIAAAQLVAAGRLDLDRPASLWLPALRGGPLGAVTVRDLLRHRSGLRRSHDRLARRPEAGRQWDLTVAAEQLSRARPRQPPGAGFAYANSNYLLLAALVEAASGEAFAGYMERHVFEPLAMTRTTLDGRRAHQWGLADLHELNWGRVRPSESVQTGWPGASLVKSTARDMAALLAAVLRGKADGLSDPAALVAPYDAGWFVSRRAEWAGGRLTLVHSGDVWGANAAVLVIPEARLALAVLINAGLNRAEDVARGIAACALGLPAPRPSRPNWTRVADNWAMIWAAAALLAAAALAVYWKRMTTQLRRGQRSFGWPLGLWERGRLLLLAGMAGYLLYLGTGLTAGSVSGPPASLRLGLQALALTASAAFLTAVCSALLPARRQQ